MLSQDHQRIKSMYSKLLFERDKTMHPLTCRINGIQPQVQHTMAGHAAKIMLRNDSQKDFLDANFLLSYFCANLVASWGQCSVKINKHHVQHVIIQGGESMHPLVHTNKIMQPQIPHTMARYTVKKCIEKRMPKSLFKEMRNYFVIFLLLLWLHYASNALSRSSMVISGRLLHKAIKKSAPCGMQRRKNSASSPTYYGRAWQKRRRITHTNMKRKKERSAHTNVRWEETVPMKIQAGKGFAVQIQIKKERGVKHLQKYYRKEGAQHS